MLHPIRIALAAGMLLPALLSAADSHPSESVPEKAYFYIHSVADMDKSLAFYRDAVGLRTTSVLSAFPSDRLSKNAQINALANTPDASFRPVYFELPGSDYGFELLQFAGIERTPVRPRLQDPGATFLILQVRKLDSILEKIKRSRADVVGTGSARTVFVKDPDGFYLLLEQPRRVPANAPKGNIVAASVGVAVADIATAQRFYQDLLGFIPSKPGRTADSAGSLAGLTGVNGAKIATTNIAIPSSTFDVELWEFKGVDQRPIHPRMQDPGASQFTLQFKEPAAARAFLKAAGIEFLSPGVVYDPNGVLILVRGEAPNH